MQPASLSKRPLMCYHAANFPRCIPNYLGYIYLVFSCSAQSFDAEVEKNKPATLLVESTNAHTVKKAVQQKQMCHNFQGSSLFLTRFCIFRAESWATLQFFTAPFIHLVLLIMGSRNLNPEPEGGEFNWQSLFYFYQHTCSGVVERALSIELSRVQILF